MGGSKVTETSIIPEAISIPEVEDNIHSLCTDAREEVELHGSVCRSAAIFIGKLYSDLHDCTVLFRSTVVAARLSDPYNDVPLPTNKNDLKTEFEELMAAYTLYNNKEIKLRKRCVEKVRTIEIALYTMTNTMSLDECIYLYGYDPFILTDYILPKLIFITNLVFRFRGMSETLLYCYQKRLGLIKDERNLNTSDSMDYEICDGDKYEAMKDYDDYIESMYDNDDDLEVDEPSTISDKSEQQIKSRLKAEKELPKYYRNSAVKSLGIFIAAQIGVETVTYLASALSYLIDKLF